MRHLVRRFFGYMSAQTLSPAEQTSVASSLEIPLIRLFYRQSVQDQRHALEVANRLKAHSGLQEAALLHDVGKMLSQTGVVGRVSATLWLMTGLPIWGRWRAYADHGPSGAAILAASGADALTVAFAKAHPSAVPKGIDPETWVLLSDADDI